MAITQTPVQVASGHGLNPTDGFTISISLGDTTGASFIRVAVSWYVQSTVAGAGMSVSDNKGNGFATLFAEESNHDGDNIAYFYWPAPAVGSGHTITVQAGTLLYAYGVAAAYAGVKATSPVETTATKNWSATGSSLQAGSLTPTSDGALLDFICSNSAAGGTPSCDLGYATVASNVGISAIAVGQFDYNLLQTTAAATNPTFSYTGSSPPNTVMLIALDPASAPPAFTWQKLVQDNQPISNPVEIIAA